jgi:hypothetical protein
MSKENKQQNPSSRPITATNKPVRTVRSGERPAFQAPPPPVKK